VTDDLLSDTRRLAARLPGRTLSAILRLLDVEPEEDDELRREWGPLLLVLDDGTRLLAEVDEGKANLLLFTQDGEPDLPIRLDVVDEDELRPLLSEPIAKVDVISRDPVPDWAGAHELSGLRLTTAGGTQALLGTHLGRLAMPGVWLLLPGEADDALHCTPLLTE
jgi:hypothetical protein